MKAIVTVFKSELKNRDFVVTQLKTLCKEVSTAEEALMFTPKDGKLVEFLSVMKFHKVAYGTHFDTRQPAPVPSKESNLV
jgi:hypothetical protein